MTFVVDVDYKFTCPPHAKVGMAFRYGLEITENEVSGYFLGVDRGDVQEGRSRIKLRINGTKIVAIVEENILITVLPVKAMFTTNESKLLNSAFDMIYTIDPNLFTLADIVEWRAKWLESQQSQSSRPLNVDDLRREVGRQLSKNREPIEVAAQDFDPELGPGVTWKESAQFAWEALEDTAKRADEMEEANKRLEEELESMTATANSSIGVAKQAINIAAGASGSLGKDNTASQAFREFDISDIEKESVQLGVPNVGDWVGRNSKNKKIYRHEDCVIVSISPAESDSDGWHEIIIKNGGQYHVLTTRFKSIVASYRLGDTEIYTAKYGSKNFLDHQAAYD